MKKYAFRFIYVWTALVTFLTFHQAYGATQVPVQTFFSYPKVSEVEISPDGKHVAMVVADGKTGMNRKELMIMDVATHKIVPCFRTSSDEVIDNYWWANSSRLLVTTADQTGSLDNPVSRGELYAINSDGSRPTQLMREGFMFLGQLYSPNKNARNIIVETYGGPEGISAYKVNIYGGRVSQVADAPREGFDLLADNSGAIRLAYGNVVSTGSATFYYRAGKHDLDWKNMHELYAKTDPASEEVGPIAFTPDNKMIYWWGRTPTSTLGLYTLDPASLKQTLLFGDPGNDIERIIWSMDWQGAQHPVAVVTMPGGPSLHVLDAKSVKVQYLRQLIGAFPGHMVRITSNSRDKSLMVVYVYSDRDPGAYYLFNAKTKQVNLLFKAMPQIEPQSMATMHPVTFKARDGLLLHGYLTLPNGSKSKNLPMILDVHGGPHGVRDTWGWNPEVQFLANRGYAVLQVNYRGSSGYGMNYQDMGYRHWGTTMQSDLADAVQWVEKQGYADPNRVCIYGASYGGYAALENSILYPGLYKCTVGYVGAYDLTLMKKANFGEAAYRNKTLKNYLDVVLGDDDATLKAESPVYQADKIKDPLFLVYGGADKTVAPENTEELMKKLIRRGFHFEKMYEPKEMHGFAKPEHNFELYTRMLAFFNKYIGPEAVKH